MNKTFIAKKKKRKGIDPGVKLFIAIQFFGLSTSTGERGETE